MTQRKTICVLSTGGTIAMHPAAHGYGFVPGALEKSLLSMPELHNSDMPHFVVHEYKTLLDSANMTPAHWVQMGEFIQQHDQLFDGFVILHGTDTMAYTASALSFMLENLNKPIILTGAQMPLFKTRSDARTNLINALWIAGNYSLAEVCVYFNNQLLRGNRSKKIDASSFDAFASPNFPVLCEVGSEIVFRHELVRQAAHNAILRLQPIDTVSIATLRLFPGMGLDLLEHLLSSSIQALILETYGVGNAPETTRFLSVIKQATEQGIIVVNSSQCWHAKVNISDYATGTALLAAGVLPGGDMTMEASIAKLFYLFSKYDSIDLIKQQFILDLCGELTS